MKKITLICVTSQNVITFRKSLIKELQSRDYSVSVIAFDSNYADEIKALGVDFYCVEDSNRSINPLRILSLKSKYKKILRKISPDTVFTFMLKPNIFGVLAAKSVGIQNVFSMVEGAGDVFINNTAKWRIIRAVVCVLYRHSLKYSKKVFFLNNDDKFEFISRKLVKAEQCESVFGVGVDLDHFAQKPIKTNNHFLMIARMLKTKGVMEYCECARRVRKKYPNAVFNYLGAEGNITLQDIKEYIDDGSINYLGTTKDVRPYIEDCICLVLPSYREGCPMAVMEASSVGRCIITTDSVGCKDTVVHGYNGLISKCQDIESLAEQCIYIVENPDSAEQMCKNSRIFAQENFDSKKINNSIIEVVEDK